VTDHSYFQLTNALFASDSVFSSSPSNKEIAGVSAE